MPKRLDATNYDTDKSELTHYLENYEEYFQPLVDKEVRLLELGVYKGGSLLLWRDYFEKGLIVGLDINPVHIDDPTGRIHIYQGQQQDVTLLSRISQEMAPEGFDVIIDDCSHIGELTHISFWHLFNNHLKPGGIYAIEDWGTGYWGGWIDGKEYKSKPRFHFQSVRLGLLSILESLVKNTTLERALNLALTLKPYRCRFPSHNYGMVGFIKALVDESGMGDITHPKWGLSPYRASEFKRMHISHGHVIITKSEQL